MTSEHLKYLQEVLEHDAIGFGEDFQFQDAVEHLEALEHASEQYRKAMSKQAKRIEQLEAALLEIFDHECRTKLSSFIACTARDALWPRAALEGKDE